MSDGLHNIAGADTTIELAGRTYRARKLTLGAQAEIEAHLVALRPDLVQRLADSLDKFPSKHHDKLLDAALRRMERRPAVSTQEVADFLRSFEGAAFLLWLMLRDGQPDLDTLDKASRLARDIPLGELQRKLDGASGMDALKNSVGRAATQPSPAAKRHASPGPASTASSPVPMAGLPET